MNFNSPIRKLLFACFIISAVLAACTKIESTTIGGELIPSVDGVITKDTVLTVVTDLRLDKDTTIVPFTLDHSLGYISNDPLFGKTQANVNFQLYPEFTPFIFDVVGKDSLFLDSVVLVLGYKGVWGDTNSTLNLKVYEIAQSQPFTDTTLHTAQTFNYTTLLGSRNGIDPKTLDDSIFARADTTKNQLRIKLDNTFGNRLLKTYDSTNAYKNDTVFNTYFNGFGVVADPVGNALLRVNLTDANTKLAIYYRVNNRAGGKDTTVKYFKYNSAYSSSSNYIKRDRSGAEIQPYLAVNATNDTLLHVQTAPGTYVNIQIPGISTFANAVIHRAELTMEQVRSGPLDDILTAPALFLSAYSADSAARFVIPSSLIYPNGAIENLGAFGAYPVRKTDANNNTIATYNFDITRYVQQTITSKTKNYDLRLFAPHYEFVRASETNPYNGVTLTSTQFNAPAAGRVRLAGGNHSKQKMRLRIIYSRL